MVSTLVLATLVGVLVFVGGVAVITSYMMGEETEAADDPLHNHEDDEAGDVEDEKVPTETGDRGDDDGSSDFRPDVSMRDDSEIGAKAGAAVATAATATVKNLTLFVSRLLPFTERFWRGIIAWGYKGLKKSTGADYIGHIVEQDRLIHEPMKFKRETDGPVDQPRYVTMDGRWWQAPAEADSTYLVKGKVPAVWASASTTELGSHVQAEVAEVLDMGGDRPLYADPTVEPRIEVDATGMDASADQQAVADGGSLTLRDIGLTEQGVLADHLVPLDTGDASGRVVSMDKYSEVYPSDPGQEKMQQQELMGKLEEKDPSADREFVMKIMLIVLGIIALVTVGPPLVKALLGGGGGGSIGGTLLG